MTLKTALYDWHVANSAKMVPFAGYDMPVQYPLGVLNEHLHTREQVGLFDVSHMGQVELHGDGIALALEKLVPGDMQGLALNQQRYTLFTNATGGVLDDLMVLNRGSHWHLVVNAACKQEDIAYLRSQLPEYIEVKELVDHALIALQGPLAAEVLSHDVPDLADRVFMSAFTATIVGVNCLLTRSGYTGEDGFEISCHNSGIETLVNHLCADGRVQPIGLGARDSLRLEAGLCLYGHDLSTETSPVAANLKWTIAQERRSGERANFMGADAILAQLEQGTDTVRVGLSIDSKAPVREGARIENADGDEVGVVCSGGFSPSLRSPIAMAYVHSNFAAIDQSLFAIVRKKRIPVTVCRMPFVPNRYYR
ncbi:MAG: glycine cleavage system aminomethyltransferase GcvT [Pseudomonadota bacterium]